MERRPCRSCRRPVFWARSAKKLKPMPLDEDAVRGNVIVDDMGLAHVFKDRAAALEAQKVGDWSSDTFISHHAEGQCPHGPAWRGKRRTDADAPPPAEEPAQVELDLFGAAR